MTTHAHPSSHKAHQHQHAHAEPHAKAAEHKPAHAKAAEHEPHVKPAEHTLAPLPRAGWIVTASHSSDAPANAISDDKASRFSTGEPQAPGQWLQIDMLEPKSFHAVTMDSTGSPGDHAQGFEVFVSNDGTDFGAAVAKVEGDGPVAKATFPKQSARYVRIVQTGTASSWWSIHDLNILG
jgi:hypothetical protein